MNLDKYRHKWWGWGPEGIEYEMEGRPDFWPWVVQTVELGDDPERHPPVELAQITLPPSRHTEALSRALRLALGASNVREDDEDRLIHCYGRSFRTSLGCARASWTVLRMLSCIPGDTTT